VPPPQGCGVKPHAARCRRALLLPMSIARSFSLGDREAAVNLASARNSLARNRKSRTGVAATKLMLVPDALRGQANSGPGDPCRPAPYFNRSCQAAPSAKRLVRDGNPSSRGGCDRLRDRHRRPIAGRCVDHWRRTERDKPSRSEAIRWLIVRDERPRFLAQRLRNLATLFTGTLSREYCFKDRRSVLSGWRASLFHLFHRTTACTTTGNRRRRAARPRPCRI
jgi:hypothetical protein